MSDVSEPIFLSFGQVIYAISFGNEPTAETVDRLRYLRRLGIPFTEEERKGSGKRMDYSFDHFFECAFAIEWMRWGLKPRHLEEAILSDRPTVRKMGRRALEEVKAYSLDEGTCAAGETTLVNLDHEIFAVLEQGTGGHTYRFDYVVTTPEDPNPAVKGITFLHNSPRGPGLFSVSVPLLQLVSSLLIHVRNAPETRPGPR